MGLGRGRFGLLCVVTWALQYDDTTHNNNFVFSVAADVMKEKMTPINIACTNHFSLFCAWFQIRRSDPCYVAGMILLYNKYNYGENSAFPRVQK